MSAVCHPPWYHSLYCQCPASLPGEAPVSPVVASTGAEAGGDTLDPESNRERPYWWHLQILRDLVEYGPNNDHACATNRRFMRSDGERYLRELLAHGLVEGTAAGHDYRPDHWYAASAAGVALVRATPTATAPCDDCGRPVPVPDDRPTDWAYCGCDSPAWPAQGSQNTTEGSGNTGILGSPGGYGRVTSSQRKSETEKVWRVAWRVLATGYTGHGSGLTLSDAQAWVDPRSHRKDECVPEEAPE